MIHTPTARSVWSEHVRCCVYIYVIAFVGADIGVFSSFFLKTRPNETEEFNKDTKNKLCLKQLFHLLLCPRGDDCPAVARLSTEIFQLLYNKCVIMYYYCCCCCFCYELHIMFFVYFYYFFKFIIFSSGGLMSYTESSRQIFNLFHIFLLLRSLHLAGGRLKVNKIRKINKMSYIF